MVGIPAVRLGSEVAPGHPSAGSEPLRATYVIITLTP
jgi:hypothetical protein